MSETKVFRWVSVAQSEPEPAALEIKDGRRVVYTCGCPDPFFIDEPHCPCVLVEEPRHWLRDYATGQDYLSDREQLDPIKPPKVPPRQKGEPNPPRPPRTHGWRG